MVSRPRLHRQSAAFDTRANKFRGCALNLQGAGRRLNENFMIQFPGRLNDFVAIGLSVRIRRVHEEADLCSF